MGGGGGGCFLLLDIAVKRLILVPTTTYALHFAACQEDVWVAAKELTLSYYDGGIWGISIGVCRDI